MTTNNHKHPPGVSGMTLFRMMPLFRRDPLQTLTSLTRQFGDVVRMKGLWTAYQFNHPRDIEHILQTNYRNYRKSKFYAEGKSSIGNGLLISEGDFWRRQRRLAQPAFHRQRIAGFAKIMTDSTEAMLEAWQPLAQRGEPLNISTQMMRLTLRIVGFALFSTDLSQDTDTVGRSLAIAREHLIRRTWQPIRLPISIPTRRNRNYRQAIRAADTVIYGILAERRRQRIDATATDDLLTMLMDARDEETGEAMSDKQLRDEAMTIMVAGHETTALALSWTWYLLSQHTEVERKLHAELAAILDGRAPTLEDIPKLKYTVMVIEEAMRLYPPAWVIGRTAINDDFVSGYRIEAKSEIILLPYVTHRHPDFWENAEDFDPERFSPERSEGRLRYAYFPFGGGPRQCIGNNFAMMEAILVLAMVAQKYRLRLVPNQTVEPEPSVTLHARHGIQMTLH